MTIRSRTLFFILIGALLLWFLYLERTILTPFIAGAIFAYIFNPVVTMFAKRFKFPRSISVVIIYLIFVSITALTAFWLTQQLIAESAEIQSYLKFLLITARHQSNMFPDFLRPTVYDLLISLQKPRTYASFSLLPLFPQALSRLISFLIFLFSGYYFLQEGEGAIKKLIALIPTKHNEDVRLLIRRINATLGGYLRGQLFLVFLMSLATFIALEILGVRFAAYLAIFSGFAEIVPLIGPIAAATLTALVVFITGNVHFGLNPINGVLVVIILYFLLRHAEDYFVIPLVMGKITKLSPFIIFFSVVTGGHMLGVLGLILAVPVAAIIKILLEFSLDRVK